MDGELLYRGGQRFCVLLNVNGQKYTIGDRFVSREEQGEFINLGQIFEVPIGDSVCEITIKEDKYYVSPAIEATSPIFINGEKILTKTELKFGDKLSISYKGPSVNVVNYTLDLFFEERKEGPLNNTSYPNEMEIQSENAMRELNPGQNELILSQILLHLSVPDLRRARFVSKLWSVEGLKILRKRAYLCLNFRNDYAYNLDTNQSMRILRYSVEMAPNNRLQNWKISIPHVTNQRVGGPSKLLEDVDFFLVDPNTRIRNTSLVKRLDLDWEIDSQADFKRCIKLLQAMSPDLQELAWGGNMDNAGSTAYKFPSTFEFNKLRGFTLSLKMIGYSARNLVDCGSWMKELITAIRGLTNLKLNCSVELSYPFLIQLGQNDVYKQFTNLNSISIQALDPVGIQLLLNLELVQPLKKLGLGEVAGMTKVDLPSFEQLLRKHSQTLESLSFILPKFLCEDSDDDSDSEDEDEDFPAYLNFPAFPKLELLDISWNGDAGLKLVFSDGSGHINYKRDLPSITSLTFCPWPQKYIGKRSEFEPLACWEIVGDFYQAFFPAMVVEHCEIEPEVCETLQFLDVLNKVPMKKGQRPLLAPWREIILAKMFPNVHNSWINAIRESSVKEKNADIGLPKIILNRLD